VKNRERGKRQGRISLHPIPFEEALRDALTIPPEPTKKRRGDNSMPRNNGGIRQVNPEEGRKTFNRLARRYFQMSGDEFERAWRQGQFDDCEQPEIAQMVVLMPLAT
jgi:hypothetical protein